MKSFARSAALVVAVALLVGCAANPIGRPGWTFAPSGTPAPAVGQPGQPPGEAPGIPAPTEPAPPAQPGQPDDGEIVGQIEVRAYELRFEPATITVDAPGRYELTLINEGVIPHDLVLADGQGTEMIKGGESVTVEVVLAAGEIEFICTVPGHADAGMKGTISVADTAGGPTPEPTDGDHGGQPVPPVTGVVDPDPNAPDPVLFDPVAPALLEGELHEIDLVMTEREMVVAPGFVQKVWTFGDTVPGPVIRVKVGDVVRIRLINPPENELPHSIDFHSSMVAWNDEMRSIDPGEELIYEWRANFAGVWMYHCGTPPALHHISNGMYGMVIVEPEGGLPEVDHEFAFVQSEWYLGPQGQPTSLAKAAEAAPAPEFVVFNGVANQYLDQPIRVETGERVRAYVLNAGPSIDSSFHIVGTIFDTVIKEGVVLARGNEGNWGSQAVDLAPAQGAIVEFEFAEDGLYPIVTHAFNFVGRGALGLFQSGEVDGEPGGGH
jgi:nitrite reductase (NO-forming)